MAKVINDFSLGMTDFSSLEQLPDLAIVNEHIGMVLNIGPYRNNFIQVGQPYRFVEGRTLMVTGGTADFELNLEQQHLEKGCIVLLMPETMMELLSCSDDFSLLGIIYKEDIPVTRNIVLGATQGEWREMLRLINSLWDIVHHTPFRRETVRQLIAAIISNIQDINRIEEERHPAAKQSRQEQLFRQFKKLINEYCTTERTIPFYAGRLAITPHYLSTLVSSVSGHSVMYWINRATILQAKVLLRNKDNMIYEIADLLHFPNQSAFGSFFKRETGMTPGEYRNE